MKYKNIKLWEHPENYAGETFYDYYVGPGQCRDSDVLAQSNFACALEQLGGESKTVLVSHCGHWAVGWVEQILVHKKDKKACKKLDEIMGALAEYPVLDESDHLEREHEYCLDYAEDAADDLVEALREHYAIPKKVSRRALRAIAVELNMERRYYAGADSCVNIYTRRKPEERDHRDLLRDLEAVRMDCRELKYFDEVMAAVAKGVRS